MWPGHRPGGGRRKNLLEFVVRGGGAGGAEARPSVAGHTAIKGVPAKPASRGAKQEPGTMEAGKTGSATEQLVAVSRVVTYDH
jgi:hypothetical protein